MVTHLKCMDKSMQFKWVPKLIVLGFNDMSTHVGHFVLSPRGREKGDSRGDEREGQRRKRNRNESEETEEIKILPSTLTCYKDSRPCPTKPISVGRPGDIRYQPPSPHRTTLHGYPKHKDVDKKYTG